MKKNEFKKYLSFIIRYYRLFMQTRVGKAINWYLHFRPKKELKRRKKILQWSVYILSWIILLLFCIDNNLFWLFGKSPHIHQINHPKLSIASELYSADGKLLGKFFNENRTPVKFEDISPALINTLVLTEDVRFYKHSGIDFVASFGVIKSLFKGEKRGGSTITQQLVKNLFKTRTNYSRGILGFIPLVKAIIYKAKEIITALKIELFYSKKEILTMYFNTVDFGSNLYGIRTASKCLFNEKPCELGYNHSALLIGLLKAPTYFSPIYHPERAKQRRNTVLGQLLKYNEINRKTYDSLISLPVELDLNMETNYDGKALYFRQAVSNHLKKWLKDNEYDLYADGLKIYSTIDSHMQEYAEEATREHMSHLQRTFYWHWEGKSPWVDDNGIEIPGFIESLAKKTKYYDRIYKKYNGNTDSLNYYINLPRKMTVFTWKGERDTLLSLMDSLRYSKKLLHAGFIAMDPNTGFVKTWVGGIDYKYFKFDHVKQFRRQPGSTFKAFLYAAALDKGYGPCDIKQDIPVTVNYIENGQAKTWAPHNADGEFSGSTMTLKHAFARSVNSIAVQLVKEIGWAKVIEYAHRLGITSPLANVPSVCLGSSDVSLYELVDAYCCFVNDGYRVEPVLLTKITDKNGKVLYTEDTKKARVLSEETAFLMMQLLWGGLTEPGGTTQALFEYDLFRYNTDFGGKTGTSSNHSDGWFIGVTPGLIGGAWVGAEELCVHFRTSELGEGCKTATPIYGKFMEKVLRDSRFNYLKQRFPKPKIKIKKNYSCHTFATKRDSLKKDSLHFE